MKMKYCKTFMKTALLWAEDSYAIRRKVGAVLADKTNTRVLDCGYNGTLSGLPNTCEREVIVDGVRELKTLPEVCHAESNVIVFAAKNGIPAQDSILYVTLSPCLECSKLIIGAGVKKVFYYEKYKDTRGLDLLQDVGVEVIQLNQLN